MKYIFKGGFLIVTMKVILDTNILIYSSRKSIDIKKAIKNLDIPKPEILVPTVVVKELENIRKSAKRGSDKDAAKLALKIIERIKFKVKDIGKGHADQVIGSWAQKNKAVVVTNDAEFSIRLKELGVAIYSLRQRRYLTKR